MAHALLRPWSMMRPLRLLPLLTLPLLVGSLVHCSGGDPPAVPPPLPFADAGDAYAPDAGPDAEPDVPLVPASKVDLLFVVDDSASMGDKQGLLARSVDRLLRRLVVDRGIQDLHVGVISTSLGGMGGDVCVDPAGQEGRLDRHAHLLDKRQTGEPVATEGGVLTLAKSGGVDRLVADVSDVIVGVGETGCGLEAQLESMYRFLVQPDPPARIAKDAENRAIYEGVDDTLLAQRRAFLRPDSAVAIVMITDEDDSNVDPRSIGGQGWGFVSMKFPGSTVFRADGRSTTAPRGTSTCAVDPASPGCESCALTTTQKDDPECQKNGGFYAADQEPINARFHRMKQRFGVDPQYPIERYVRGLTTRMVPDRATEHDDQGRYVHAATCTNPLFAASLPGPGEAMCDRPQGARSRQLVTFQLIGGLPSALAGKKASDVSWTKVLGADPEAYDTTGIDPHMVQSMRPRSGLEAPSATRGNNGSDPVHGREWDTKNDDLQYACTFELPAKRTCQTYEPGCDCGTPERNPPLCAAAMGEQTRGKAYPTLRELRLAKALGERAIVSSICGVDAQLAYGPALDLLVDRMTPVLAK